MSTDLDPLLKRLSLANARRVWRDLVVRAETEEWSYEQLLLTLFSEEIAHRRGTRLNRAVRSAGLPFLKTVEEFDFSYQSTLRLTTIGSLLSPDFVTVGNSVILVGKTGRGKTHLAISLAYRAMQSGFDALFTNCAELIDDLSYASRDGGLREALSRYVKPHVLVVDEVGYLTYGDDAANVLFHVVNERHIKKRSMVFTTNKHPKRWGPVLHDDDLAEAIVDRILDRGRLLRLDGPSMRTKHLADDPALNDDQDETERLRISGTNGSDFPEPTTPRAFGVLVASVERPSPILARIARASLAHRQQSFLDYGWGAACTPRHCRTRSAMVNARLRGRVRPLGLAFALGALGCSGSAVNADRAGPTLGPPTDCRVYGVRTTTTMAREAFLLLDERADVPEGAEARAVPYGPPGSNGEIPSVSVTDLAAGEAIPITLLPYRTGRVCALSSNDVVAVNGVEARRLDLSSCGEHLVAEQALAGTHPDQTLHRMDHETLFAEARDIGVVPEVEAAFAEDDLERLRELPAGSRVWMLRDEDPQFPYVVVVVTVAHSAPEHIVRRRDGSLVRRFSQGGLRGILLNDDGAAQALVIGGAGCQLWPLTPE